MKRRKPQRGPRMRGQSSRWQMIAPGPGGLFVTLRQASLRSFPKERPSRCQNGTQSNSEIADHGAAAFKLMRGHSGNSC